MKNCGKVFCKTLDSFIYKIDKGVFFSLENYLIKSGQGADKDSFEVIKNKLQNNPVLSADDFAFEVFYVILASGFNQRVAIKKFNEIKSFIGAGNIVSVENLLHIFANKNKMAAICKIWNNREKYRDDFYNLISENDKLNYLETLPFIGNITKNHLARNLGMNTVKYDLWIKRLGGTLYSNIPEFDENVLTDEIQIACDNMFKEIERETSLKRGYIDVVLWKSCQIGLLKFQKNI